MFGMYKNQTPYIKASLLPTPHYKITVATTTTTTATNPPPPILNCPSRHEEALLLNLNPNPNTTFTFPPSMFAPAHLMITIVSWLRTRRTRCFFLLLCSPLLLPFLCATFPLLCIAEVCVRICRRRSSGKAAAEVAQDEEENGLRRCEEGCCCWGEGDETEVGLLQRYLEDQLALVGSVYDCGDYFDDNDDDQDRDADLNLHCKIPLLS